MFYNLLGSVFGVHVDTFCSSSTAEQEGCFLILRPRSYIFSPKPLSYIACMNARLLYGVWNGRRPPSLKPIFDPSFDPFLSPKWLNCGPDLDLPGIKTG